MKTIKISEATELRLDWLVAKCENVEENDGVLIWFDDLDRLAPYTPTTNWSQGGPIIEREEIGFAKYGPNGTWKAVIGETPRGIPCYGPTPLIAALRCFVTSRLGDEVDVPSELLK